MIKKKERLNKETELEDSIKAENIDPQYDVLLKTGYYPALPKVMDKIKNDGYKLFDCEE